MAYIYLFENLLHHFVLMLLCFFVKYVINLICFYIFTVHFSMNEYAF